MTKAAILLAPQRPADARIFVGRAQIVEDLSNALVSQLSVALFGGPGTGKTSTLLAIQRRLGPTIAHAHVEMQGKLDAPAALSEIVKALAMAWRLKSPALGRKSLDTEGAREAISLLRHKAFNRAGKSERQGTWRPVVLLDDAHRLERDVRAELWSALNSLVDNGIVALAVAGRSILWDEACLNASVLWHLLHPKRNLEGFSLTDVEELFDRARAYDLIIEPRLAPEAYRATRGHPYSLTYILHTHALRGWTVTSESFNRVYQEKDVAAAITQRIGIVSDNASAADSIVEVGSGEAGFELGVRYQRNVTEIVIDDTHLSNIGYNIQTTPDPQRRSQPMTANSNDRFDVAIICALRTPELRKVLDTGKQPWEPLSRDFDDPSSYRKTVFTTVGGTSLRVVAAAPNQMGMPAAAVLATKMIRRFRPNLVAMVGIAAGVKTTEQGFGDVLAPDCTLDYGAGKVSGSDDKLHFRADPNPIPIIPILRERLKEWTLDPICLGKIREIREHWQARPAPTALQLHVGPLGSGAAVIAAARPIEAVQEHWRKLIGIEMETYGVHIACQEAIHPPPMFLCMKSICDFASPDKDDDWQHYAAFTSAQLCHLFLTSEWEVLFPRAAALAEV